MSSEGESAKVEEVKRRRVTPKAKILEPIRNYLNLKNNKMAFDDNRTRKVFAFLPDAIMI